MLENAPNWFNPSNIAGFQTYPTKRVIFRDDTPSQDITARELIWACREMGISVSSLTPRPSLSREQAIAQYRAGEITEGQLTESLGVDRLEARRIIQEQETES